MSGHRGNRSIEERMARKRESEAIYHDKWQAQSKYYENCDRDSHKFNSWTSPQSSTISLKKYEELKQLYKSGAEKEEEENRKVCIEYKQKQEKEIAEREERIKYRNRFDKREEVPTSVLREINNDLKTKEDAIRRIEAEKKLYQQWRLSNPYVKEHEMNQRQKNLKVAWLDAQIEKQMAKEKEEEEMKKYLAERDKQIKDDEEMEQEHKTLLENKQKEIYQIVEKQIEELKKKDELADLLRLEENAELKRQEDLELIAREREEMVQRKSRIEMDLQNLDHNRLKLRRRAKVVAEQIEEEQQFLERILKLQEEEKDEENSRKLYLRNSIIKAMECLKEQRRLESKRQELLGVLFDSEAKAMWQKQELVWTQEKKSRDDFFKDVLRTIQQQIQEKIEMKMESHKQLVIEREQMLQQVEEYQEELRQQKEEAVKQKEGYSQELDMMVLEKKVSERQKLIDEEMERKRELEHIKAEEEKLRQEIAKIQLETDANVVRYRRRKLIW